MKAFYLLCAASTLLLTSCATPLKSEPKNLSIKKLKEEPWYFCNTDSLWTYDDYGNSVICSDYQKVTRLRVTNILGEIYFKGGYDGYCELTDSIIIGQTIRVTASDLNNMAVPIDSLKKLQVLDISRHHFFSFPYEVFELPNLTALNVDGLCLHDYCEPCIYIDETYLKRTETGKSYVDTADFDNYYQTDLRPYYDGMRKLKFISGGRYNRPDDSLLIDRINRRNNLEKNWAIFECTHPMCDFQSYVNSEVEMMEVEIIWE